MAVREREREREGENYCNIARVLKGIRTQGNDGRTKEAILLRDKRMRRGKEI